MMKKTAYFLLLLFLFSCAKVPVTGRRQINMLPESQLMSMSLTQYKAFLNDSKPISRNNVNSKMVNDVGQKIARAAEAYLKQKHQNDRVKGFNWEFNLVDDPTVNAWCMPGGKVVFYTGILPYTQDELGMAVVMGHEVAHAIARHGNERMSQGLVLQAGGIGLQLALQDKPELTQNLLLQSYGIGGQLGMLKYSRMHESEADKMGLIFMAITGYNPEAAPEFWKRMAQNGGQAPPEILSTHPHDETRIADINSFMPEALKYYKP